jgi:hypothetical protein
MKSSVVGFMLLIALMIVGVSHGQECATIQSGTLKTTEGAMIETGFDTWGYNYQAHMFNGTYCDSYRNASWCQPYKDVELQMKWNDAWLSNKDCNGDGLLDRHFGFAAFRGSGAWLTNHQKGIYLDANGKKQRWNYFSKIVAAPLEAVNHDGHWWMWDEQSQTEVEIGPVIWDEFAIVQDIYNDTGTGEHGIFYLSPYSAGFGAYGPKD